MPSEDSGESWGQDTRSLPKLSKTELLKRYRTRIDASRRWREDEKYDATWRRLRDIYRLKMLTGTTDQDAIAVAIAFATINVIAPSVAVNHPHISVNAQYPEHEDQATITEAVVNYWWRHYGVQPEFRRAVKDFLVYGHGWLKVGYRYQEGQRPIHPDKLGAMHSDLSAQADQFAAENPHLADQLPTDEEIAGGLPDTESFALVDRPFIERVSPFDMYVDPEATCLEDAAWIAQRIVRPIEEVKADKRFKQSVRRDLEADGSVKFGGEQDPRARTFTDTTAAADMKRITLWEFYDVTRGTVSVFTKKSGDGFLIDPRPWDYPYGLPFKQLRNYEVPDAFYPIGEIEAIEPLQDELNETRTDMVHARKSDIPKYMYRRDAFDEQGIDALKSNVPNTAIPIRDDTQFDQVLKLIEQPSANAQMYQQHSQTIEADIDRVTGVNEYMRGSIPETRRTATEASMIQDAANSRAADKLATIESFIAEVAKCLVQLAQTYMDGEHVVRIVGQTGAKLWVPFTSADIEGEFDFEVEGGSTQPQNDTFKRQQAMQMATALGPYVEQGVVDPRALVTSILKDGYGIKNPQAFILPPPPPQAPQPNEKLIESINYKDAPPDIQRQMEAQAGFQPSRIGGSSPAEQGSPSVGTDPNAPAPAAGGGTPGSSDSTGGNQAPALPAEQQLAGQVGLETPNLGGGALGPGGVKNP